MCSDRTVLSHWRRATNRIMFTPDFEGQRRGGRGGGGGKDGGKSSCVLSCVRTLALAYAAVIPVLAVVPEPADFATFWKRVF